MKKRDLLEAWKKVCKYPENNDAIGCINDLLENLPDDEPKECEHIGCVPPNTECDVVTEHIRHGLEWAAKTAQPKVPEWETTLAYIVRPGTIVNFEEVKQLFREEMKKLGNDIKAKLLPERYYPDVSMHTRNQTWIDNAIYEALHKRGVL